MGQADQPHNPPAADDGTATKPEAEQRPNLAHVAPEWGLTLIVVSIVVGAVLLGAGVWAEMTAALDGTLSTTFIVSGLALIFGAFGTQATVRYKGWVIAGVAATALIFLFAIDYLRRDSYVLVELQTTKKPTSTIKAGNAIIKGTVDVDGAQLRTQFFVRYKDVSDRNPRFDIELPNQNNESEKLIVRVCFTRDKLIRWFGHGRQVNWWLDESDMKVLDNDKNLIGSKTTCPGYKDDALARLPSFGISSAYAQSAADVNSLIQDLLSENTDVRRLTRDQLADAGPSVVRPLMDMAIKMTSSNDRLAFRMQVGAAVAIDRMITRDPKPATTAAVLNQLTAADIDALIQWSLDRDQSLLGPTLRILASTADLVTLQKLMKVVEHQGNENIIYNMAWILRQSAQRYRSDPVTLGAIKELARSLKARSPGEKTTNFLNQTEAISPSN